MCKARGTRSGFGIEQCADFARCSRSARRSADGQGADQSGVNHAGEPDAWNVARARIDTVKIPAGLARFRVVPVQKTAAVLKCEYAGEPPLGIFQPADVVDIDHEQIAGLGALDAERAAQIMHFGQVDVPDVIGGIVVFDLAAGPVVTFDPELVAWFEPFDDGNVWMPAVMGFNLLVFRPLVHFGREYGLCHHCPPSLPWWRAVVVRASRPATARCPTSIRPLDRAA